MSNRSRQARQLSLHLAEATGTRRVELVYDTGASWHLNWTDGPTAEQMHEHLTTALAGHHFPDLRDRTIRCHRGTSPRAWAARAIAAHREGTLQTAVAEYAAAHRSRPLPYTVRHDRLTVEHHGLLQHVDDLLRATSHPDRASDPDDEPLIEQLLTAGPHPNEFTMTDILLNAITAPAGDLPAQLHAVPERRVASTPGELVAILDSIAADPPSPRPAPAVPSHDEVLAQSAAAEERFLQALPAPREVTTTGELAAILAALPADTPLFLADQVLARPELTGPDIVQTIVAHLTPCAEPTDPGNPGSLHRMMPALGLTTIHVEQDRDASAEFEHSTLQPVERLARAEERLNGGELEGGIQDAADSVELVAHLLNEGTKFIPSDHDAHTALQVETSRLRHAAERLRHAAADAQQASE
jgi:hypothetical protein